MPETTNRQPDNRSRRLFAAITAAATLMILWVLYDSEFHYADTAKAVSYTHLTLPTKA